MRVQFLRYMGEDREYIDKIQRETGVTVGEAAAAQLTRELQEKKITGMIEPDTYLFAGDTYLIEGTIEADGATLQKAYDDGVAGERQMLSVPTAVIA